ncbi:ribosomal protein S12 methylthiotransferase RimO [Lentimicrobium saccharophilum]|uniref:Ribosomal protein uS12 methylthiotransferase RimO n=1 Tax=Lentimicrobium saccharophilum TaxID=1678841 RepID=A0A0S7C4T7_9BACT|nr:30S ribosomal protein S12 methylthiotransferase RimO [Lentimicrobium saccharophilum]GAP44486.1 ribosomal protein S12 methylthiotransferase RimO [Lentimicrobium saccharophilum]
MKSSFPGIKTANIITLGCSKNLVDSEVMMRQLKAAGIETLHDSNSPADVVIINTCGFINDAKEESVDTILQWAGERKRDKIRKLYVMGCLSQRYKEDLVREMPEVDGFFGVNDLNAILSALNAPLRNELLDERVITTPAHYAYLKISEGCDRKCSFCAIPQIRGKNISKPVDQLVSEARFLAGSGVKELILIAQDLTYYGIDLNGKRQLAGLLEVLSGVDGIDWIRLHYAFPAGFPLRVLDIMRDNPKICRYLDIPLQHISNRILKSMKRGLDGQGTRNLIRTIRQRVPGIAIRSSFIVGYPGETNEEFNELKRFISENEFERLGVFTYSHEENTPAFRLKDDVRPAVKARRAEQIMLLQQDISAKRNAALIGNEIKVIVDRKENGYWSGRSEFDSPEVDNEVVIDDPDGKLYPGLIASVKITGADLYDLKAIAI